MQHITSLEASKNPDIAGAALRTFFRIAEHWALNNDEQQILLGKSRATLFKWKKTTPHHLDHDTLERISYIFGIYKALQLLIPNPEEADKWIKKPNKSPLFGGKPALSRMLSGNVADLYVVRQYLDAQRGGWA